MFPAWCMDANVIFQICSFPRVLFCLFQKHGKTRPVSFYASEDLEHCQFCLVKIHIENWLPSQIYLFWAPQDSTLTHTHNDDDDNDFGLNIGRAMMTTMTLVRHDFGWDGESVGIFWLTWEETMMMMNLV